MTPQIHLIASNDAQWVTQQREQIVSELVPDEMRDENLLELYAMNNRALELSGILSEVQSELSTIPFLPDSRRVVVIHDLKEMVNAGGRRPKGKPKKKSGNAKLSPEERFVLFLERDLSATDNQLILSTIIDDARGQSLNDKSALYTFISKSPLGRIIRPPRRETDPIFLLTDAMLDRNAPLAIRHFRHIYRDDARTRIFNAILRNTRLLLQTKMLEKIESGDKSREFIEMTFLPNAKSLNLYKEHKFVQQKLRAAAPRFSLRELMQALDKLFEINCVIIPSPQDKYIPDIKLLMETYILDFCARS